MAAKTQKGKISRFFEYSGYFCRCISRNAAQSDSLSGVGYRVLDHDGPSALIRGRHGPAASPAAWKLSENHARTLVPAVWELRRPRL